MTRLVAIVLCAITLSVHAFAQGGEAPPGSVSNDNVRPNTVHLAKIPREQLVEDFRVARSALEEGHSGLYRHTKKADLNRIFDNAEGAIDRPMDVYEFYRILAPSIASIKCGHTRVSLPKDVESDLAQRVLLLPLQVKVIGGKPYVFRDFSSSSSSLAGLEIRSIDGVPAAAIVKTLVSVIPGDGDTETSREERVSDWRFATDLVRMFGLKNHYSVTLRDAMHRRETRVELAGVELPKLLGASRQRYPQDQWDERSADLELLDGGATAHMTVRGFGGFADADRKKDLRQFFKESFETMRARGTKALILDVRDNGGGEDELGRILLSYLVDTPFVYYEDLVLNKTSFGFAKYALEKVEIPENLVERRADGRYHAVGHPNWGTQQPREPVFRGKVVALINGGSFSTTSEFLSQLHDHHRAKFVGEESGGGYYGNTSGPDAQVVLPNSKLVVQIPLLTYYMAVRGFRGAESHGIVPDYSAIPSVADLIAGRDPAMEKALVLARPARVAGK